ncbi:MAG: 16S rRNA (cytosine(1402)-N(4))-methyltransferase RsmH [Firmicutes bacterium]|nr:16S rRNA (cytosine(1402)-N(4))-methyltransferase RsmH [Bacillota bacterium]
MEFSHIPVLYEPVLQYLDMQPGQVFADGTLGGGGHSLGIAGCIGAAGTLIGIDRDKDALAAAGSRLAECPCTKHFVQSNYSDIKSILAQLGIPALDGALLDIGVSSFQLDNPERGFSYMQDAPLDMRMNTDDGFTAADLVNGYSKEELIRVIRDYGEERWAARIAEFIVKERQQTSFTTTFQLVDVIKRAIPSSARRDGPHPAKRTFQALRIEVNDELGQLTEAVEAYTDVLAPGGRLAIITFHSLEDRIVKEYFRKRLKPCTCPPDFPVCVCGKKTDIRQITRKPVEADQNELDVNPRARSAKLRVIEKL